MKKTCIIIGLVVALATVALAGVYSFMPAYFIMGQVNNSDDGVSPDGLRIVFARSEAEALSGIYAYDIVGADGVSGIANRYNINAFQTIFTKPIPGETWQVAVEKNDAGYGAGPVDVLFTGKGFELVGDLKMALGEGWDKLPTQLGGPQPPVFTEIWFNKRLYHKTLVEEGEQFVTTAAPIIKMKIEGVYDFGIKADSVQIVVDEGASISRTYTISSDDITKTVKTAAIVSAMDVEYSIPAEDAFNDKEETDHTFSFSAYDASGSVSTTEVCTVTIMSGPAKIIGPVVVYPSPFSPSRPANNPNNETECTIQYTLSVDADVEIFIYSIAGELIKRFYGRRGHDVAGEGGTAGVNKVIWDGKTTFGDVAGNGIYAGTIYDPAQNKTLKTFKLTIVH